MKTSYCSVAGGSLRPSSAGRKKPPIPSATGEMMIRDPMAPEQKGWPSGSSSRALPASAGKVLRAHDASAQKSAAVPREEEWDGRGASGRRHLGAFIAGSGVSFDPRGRRIMARLHAERQPAPVRSVDELDQKIGGAAAQGRERAAVSLPEQLARELLRRDTAEKIETMRLARGGVLAVEADRAVLEGPRELA